MKKWHVCKNCDAYSSHEQNDAQSLSQYLKHLECFNKWEYKLFLKTGSQHQCLMYLVGLKRIQVQTRKQMRPLSLLFSLCLLTFIFSLVKTRISGTIKLDKVETVTRNAICFLCVNLWIHSYSKCIANFRCTSESAWVFPILVFICILSFHQLPILKSLKGVNSQMLL